MWRQARPPELSRPEDCNGVLLAPGDTVEATPEIGVRVDLGGGRDRFVSAAFLWRKVVLS